MARVAHARIVYAPHILGGEPTVRGTRVPVRAVVLMHRLSPEMARLRQAFPMLTGDDITAALCFYDAHQAEIERYIAENVPGDQG